MLSEPTPQEFKTTTVPCQYWYDDKWYDLTTFDSQAAFSFFTSTPNGASVQYGAWNFCKKLSDSTVEAASLGCSTTSQAALSTYAAIINYSTGGNCEAASTSNLDSIATADYTMANSETTFGLQYTSTDTGISLLVGLICDPNAENWSTTALVDMDGTGQRFSTSLTSAEVCPSFDMNALWSFLDTYSYLWGAMFIVGGIFFCFFGKKLFKAAIFIVTAILTVFGILLLFYTTFLKDTTEAWVGWTVLVCSILIGLVAGFFVMKLERLGAALLAGWGGFLLGVMLNEMVLYKAESTAVFWSISVACAIIAAVLSFFMFEHVLILGTSFGGAYMLVRGVSLYAGGFPNEFTLVS